MEDRLEKYLRFIREVERLKSVERTAWTTSGRRESTAEHSWRLALLAMVLCGEYPRLDRLRVLQLALVHDLGETYDGDIPAVAQGDPAAKERVERAAVERLAGCLPEGAGRELRGVWEEYEACRTPEAKLVKALDKAETILQHNQGQNPSGFDYEFNLGYGAEWFRADEMLQRLRGLLDADTIRAVLREAVEHAGIADAGTALAGQVTVRRGTNARGEQVTYLLNYSADEVTIASPVSGDVVVAPVVVGSDGTVDESATAAVALKEGAKIAAGDMLTIGRWNVAVIAG